MPKFVESNQTNTALNKLEDAAREFLAGTELKQQRTIAKRFYLTEAEDLELETLRQGVSFSAFVRAKVFGAGIPRPRPIVPTINREACIALANIRANCNQMAKAANSAAQRNTDLPLTQAYLDQLARLEALLVSISLQLRQTDAADQEED